MDNKTINEELSACIEDIVGWYTSDVFILLDNVLTDDVEEPEFSANTVCLRLKQIIKFRKLWFGSASLPLEINEKDIQDYILSKGYSHDDVELLQKKCLYENIRHEKNNRTSHR